jgi:hypothetical protein
MKFGLLGGVSAALTFNTTYISNNRYVSMFKKIVFTVPMAVLSLSSAVAFAADDARSSINISATIPSKVFHAQPRDPNFGVDEKMAYDLAKGTLSALRATYDVRHTTGGWGPTSRAVQSHCPMAPAPLP